MLLTEMLSSEEMKELMTSFNKISTLHPRKDKSNVQEIKDQVQEMAKLEKSVSAQQDGPDIDISWYKTFCSI